MPRPFLITLSLIQGLCLLLASSACQPSAPAKSTSTVASPTQGDAAKRKMQASDQSADIKKASPKPKQVNHPDPIENLPTLAKRGAGFHRGVSLGLFASTKDEEAQRAIYTELLDEIKAVGATDISVIVRWSQDNVHAHEISRHPQRTASDALLTWVIAQSRARGLRVFLMPIIHLEKRKMGVWRGTLDPKDPDAWWASYTAFILYYAKLAKTTGVSLFAVGSELLSMEAKTKRWHKLIASVRRLYKGKLTYSSNWDHFEVVTFWDKLDVVGMTAYQELTKRNNPSVSELKRGWRGFSQRLKVWAGQHGHRYIFTEVGYPSHTRGAAYPWDYRPRGQADPMLQARAYRAMMEVWEADKRFDGLYVWNWFGFKSLQDRGYTPRGKPAEAILKHWYTTTGPLPDAKTKKEAKINKDKDKAQ